MSFDENEVSKNAFGGTEIAKRKLGERLDRSLLGNFQIIPSRVREVDESKIRVYWAHDLPGDPECDFFKEENKLNMFHKFMWISQWQYQLFQVNYGFPYDERSTVIESWLEPLPYFKKEHDTINLYYASTPQRGLDILVPVFNKLCEEYKNIHLHVHSSFEIYGWPHMDKQFESLFNIIRNHPQMTYHGYTKREEFQKRLENYHILAYPCTWLETSCRVLMEAMSARCYAVFPNYGALPDTSGGLAQYMYQGAADKHTHAGLFHKALRSAIQTTQEDFVCHLDDMKRYVDGRFGIEHITARWDAFLQELLKQYPTVESRKFKQAQFVYKVG